jgi:hypothetical protein
MMIFRRTRLVVWCLFISLPAAGWAEDAIRTVITKDGRQVEGTIIGGSLTIKSAIKTREVEARRIHALSRTLLKDDEGHTLVGALAILSGDVRVMTDKGTVTIPAQNIELIKAADMFMTPLRPSGGGMAGEGSQDPAQLILGRWQDSSSIAWEFFKDGTLVSGQLAGRYSFVGSHRVKIEISSPVGMQEGSAFVMPGTQAVRVYEIVDLTGEQLVWDYQGNQITMTRVP